MGKTGFHGDSEIFHTATPRVDVGCSDMMRDDSLGRILRLLE